MYPYIVCLCGRSIGDLYDLFKQMKLEKIIELYGTSENIDPTLLSICEDTKLRLDDVFEALNINMDCCRVRMMTMVEFKDLY